MHSRAGIQSTICEPGMPAFAMLWTAVSARATHGSSPCVEMLIPYATDSIVAAVQLQSKSMSA